MIDPKFHRMGLCWPGGTIYIVNARVNFLNGTGAQGHGLGNATVQLEKLTKKY